MSAFIDVKIECDGFGWSNNGVTKTKCPGGAKAIITCRKDKIEKKMSITNANR